MFLVHPFLGPRYRECIAAVRAAGGLWQSLEAIFRELDAIKFGSWGEILEESADLM